MRKVLCVLTVAVLLASFATPASADVITFDGPGGPLMTPTVEGIFRYEDPSMLFLSRNTSSGNPLPAVSTTFLGGGVLHVVRDDILGGRFTFDQVDVAQATTSGGVPVARPIEIEGFLGGVSQAVDIAMTTAVNDNYATFVANALSGVIIDELRITLSSGGLRVPTFFESVDNLTLTPIVPEPAGLALLAIGVAAVAVRRRRSR